MKNAEAAILQSEGGVGLRTGGLKDWRCWHFPTPLPHPLLLLLLVHHEETQLNALR